MNPALAALSNVPWLYAAGWTVLHSLWQGALIALLTGGVLGLMRNRSAASRHLVAGLGLAAMLLLPVGTVAWNMVSGQPTLTAELAFILGQLIGASSLGVVAQQALPILGALWLAGASFSLLRTTVQWRRARVLVRRGVSQASDEMQRAVRQLCTRLAITRPVRVLRSTIATVPMVIGWGKPVILMPVQAATGLDPDQLRAILAHELAHVARQDYLVNLVQVVIESLMFYHPGVWWLSRRVRNEREFACDDLAVAVGPGAVGYARALATLEQARASDYRPATPATGGSLFHRIARLVNGQPAPRSSIARALSPLLVALTLVLALITAEVAPLPGLDTLATQQIRPRRRRQLAPGETPPEPSSVRLRTPAPGP